MPGRVAVLVVTMVLACTAAPTTPTSSPARSEPAATVGVVPASGAPGAACPAIRQISLGAISGKFGYPSEGSPPLALIAVRVEDPRVFRMLHTPRLPGGALIPYAIGAIEPGTYVVLAFVEGSGDGLAGAGRGPANATDRSEPTAMTGTRSTSRETNWPAAGSSPTRSASDRDTRARSAHAKVDPMRFGFWMPVFGGWLRNVEDEGLPATFEYQRELALRAEATGWDLTLIAE